MILKKILAVCALAAIATGCGTIAEKTNMLSDQKIKSETAGVLGHTPDDLTIVSRRTEGTNTYVALKNKQGKEFNCIINGGNILSAGLVNPPTCAKKGEPLKVNPFGR